MSAAEDTGDSRHSPARQAVMRYAIAIAVVAAAILATSELQRLAEKPLAFPFYAAVVVSAWTGAGPGLVALILSTLAVQFLWAEPRFSLIVGAEDLPWFISFVLCSVVAFAWSMQRRRAQDHLEATVEERTAELRRSNAALQVEITERAAAEQALRDAEAELARTLRVATMAEVAAAIAHEINQPLAAITANGGACLRSLARDPPLLDNARDAASCIVADGHRAGDVIARIRALFNKEEPDRRRVDINEVIGQVLQLSQRVINRQGVAVAAEVAPSPVIVMGDAVQLRQVLVNLVTNALEAMDGITDRAQVLTVRCKTADDGMAVVSVEDTGHGLAAGEAAHIFESFYTTKPDGIGVGLAISRSIIEAHSGSLWAVPDMPVGARIGFSLPLAPRMG